MLVVSSLILLVLILVGLGVMDPAVDAHIGAGMAHAALSSVQGHAFTMEANRLASVDGRISGREALSHRTIQESGGGQARAFLPAGLGGVPSIPVSAVNTAGS